MEVKTTKKIKKIKEFKKMIDNNTTEQHNNTRTSKQQGNAQEQGTRTRTHAPGMPPPLDELAKTDPERARRIRSAGGKAAAEARRQRKTMRETLAVLLDLATEKGKLVSASEVQHMGELAGKPVDVQTAMLVALVNRVILAGDVRAAEFIRDTVGEKPAEQVQLDATTRALDGWSDEELRKALDL